MSAVILFDGVCNLCNAAVRWVIERDQREIFRFASLQSLAGREALAAAGAPAGGPDSVILVDESGVHTQAEAMLRICGRLGFPWSLARVGRALPRRWRDALYAWVACHRYRWFGRRDACLKPTPALRGRFLDADEPIGLVDHTPGAEPPKPASASGAIAVVHRFLLVYLVLYNLPFPIGYLPGTERLGELCTELTKKLVVPVGWIVFGIPITVFPAGSGDTTYNYVEVFTLISLAMFAALAISAAGRFQSVSPRIHDGVATYVRYTLAATLLSYGWVKLVPLQMPPPGPDRLLNPIGETSPMGLLWTLMGASSAYQIFSGLGEALAGALLLWRRTALAGALLAVGVLTNIVMLNFSYDVPVKLYSLHLFLMAVFLLMPQLPRLVAVLFLNLPAQTIELDPYPPKGRRTAMALHVAKAVFVVLVAVLPAYLSYQGLMARRTTWHSLHGIYRVESFTRSGVVDRNVRDEDRWVRVGITRNVVGTIQRADGSAGRFDLEVDKDKKTLRITYRGQTSTATLNYEEVGPDMLRLEGDFEGAPTLALLRKQREGDSPLLSRGFHWVSEVPFNR